jgi:hypothetical protein
MDNESGLSEAALDAKRCGFNRSRLGACLQLSKKHNFQHELE